MPAIDFSKAKTLEPLTGTFDAICTKCEYFDTSKNSNYPKLDFQFTLNDGEYEGRKVFRSSSLQEQALWATKEILIALGYDPDKLVSTVDTDDIIEFVVGRECRVVLSAGTYNNKPSQNVDRVMSQYDV
jgi:hypothetical protein